MADIKIPAGSFKPLTQDTHEAQEKISAPSLTFTQDAIRRLKQNKVAVVSLVVLLIVMLAALLAPVIAPQSPNTQNVAYANLPPKIGSGNIPGFTGKMDVSGVKVDKYQQAGVPKGKTFILGTDYLGRDLLSRILYGTRLSLLIGILATLVDLLIGIPYGIVSGWRGGRLDTPDSEFILNDYYSNDVYNSECDFLRSVLELYRDWDSSTECFIRDVIIRWAKSFPFLAISNVVSSSSPLCDHDCRQLTSRRTKRRIRSKIIACASRRLAFAD